MTGRDERWHVSETDAGDAVIYVKRTLPTDGSTYAHVLFEADWADKELALHVANLHNIWLSDSKVVA